MANAFIGIGGGGSGTSAFIGKSSTSAASAGTVADTGLLRGSVADILGLQSKASIDEANAAASGIQSAGYQQEVNAYNIVGGIGEENAKVAGIAGDIKALQENRQLRQTIGAQRADIASAGFANSGSSLDLMRSSVQQGALARQLIRIQTAQTQGGYLEEAAASQAEAAGATMASTAAQALATQQRASGQLATANAANETAALNTYLAGATATPESQLVTSTLTGTPGQPATFTPPTGGAATLGTGLVKNLGSQFQQNKPMVPLLGVG